MIRWLGFWWLSRDGGAHGFLSHESLRYWLMQAPKGADQ